MRVRYPPGNLVLIGSNFVTLLKKRETDDAPEQVFHFILMRMVLVMLFTRKRAPFSVLLWSLVVLLRVFVDEKLCTFITSLHT